MDRPLLFSGLPHQRSTQQTRLWVCLAIIIGALAGGAWMGGAFSMAGPLGGPLSGSASIAQSTLLRILGFVIGIGVLLAFLRWPPLGIAAVVVGALTVPMTLSTGTGTVLNVAVVLVGVLTCLWILEMTARHRIEVLPSGPIWPLSVFIVMAVLAFGAGMQPWMAFVETASLPAQAGGLAVFLLSASAFLLMAHQVRDVRWLQAITWLFLAAGAWHVAARSVPGASALSVALAGREGLGSLFWTWLAALAFSQAVFNRSLGVTWRLALWALVLVTFYVGVVLSGHWTSGWLPPLVAVVVALVVGAPRVAPLLALSGAVAALLKIDTIQALLLGGDNEYSLMTRLEAWRILGEIITINPILGLGFSNYSSYTPLFPILGYAVRFNSHNNYVDIAAQTGLLGLACFLWFACAVGLLAWRLRRKVPAGFQRAYVYGALGGLAGTMVAGALGDWVLPYIYNVGLNGFRASVLGWLFLGGLVALERMARQAAPTEGEASDARS